MWGIQSCAWHGWKICAASLIALELCSVIFYGLHISSESMGEGFPLHFGGPHLTGESACNASPPSFRCIHLTGMLTGYASPPSLRWCSPRRNVDGVCIAASISMGSTSPGCRRVMPRHHQFNGQHLGCRLVLCLRRMGGPWGPKVPTLGPNDRTADRLGWGPKVGT